MHWNPVDLLLLVIVLVGAATGWARGFLFSALDLLTLAASLAAAFLGLREATRSLGAIAPSLGVWLAPLSFVGIFLLVHFLLGTVALRLAQHLPAKVHRNLVNRLFGLAPGAVNGCIHAAVVAVLLLTLPLGAHVGAWAHESTLAARFATPAEWVEVQLAPVFDPALRRTFHAVTVDAESRETIALHFRLREAQPRPDLEASLLEMVNAERRAARLQPLRADAALARLARSHDADMFARGYFSHITPDGQDLAHRLQDAHLGYLVAGENIALAPTLVAAHDGLMHSPGHRANILRPQFGRVGIGVLDGGPHGLMVTQDFRN